MVVDGASNGHTGHCHLPYSFPSFLRFPSPILQYSFLILFLFKNSLIFFRYPFIFAFFSYYIYPSCPLNNPFHFSFSVYLSFVLVLPSFLSLSLFHCSCFPLTLISLIIFFYTFSPSLQFSFLIYSIPSILCYILFLHMF